ncbi:hypothetical protein AVEN_101861-1 [Araneus ventricosus]|uniref:Uncharacterized protein n=1 Tax=Araneus ventricosus TaxID=182803 RepID=A0A4Y2D8D9_ARAVE|nr:hypothetical protein AVEN_240677-1 [Araneus ventricosus]GBM12990.1 hypothetical protein AVEN_101861-1 [Araneus ventricosus]
MIMITGKDLSSFGMHRPHRIDEVSNHLMRELDYDNEELQQRLNDIILLLNREQNLFDYVLQQIESGEGGEGRFRTDSNNIIELNRGFCKIVQSTEELIGKVYPEVQANMGNRK